MEHETPEQESGCEVIATGLIVALFKTIGFVFLFVIDCVVLMLSSETDTSDPLAARSAVRIPATETTWLMTSTFGRRTAVTTRAEPVFLSS